MHRLVRTVRFALAGAADAISEPANTHAGFPRAGGFAPHLAIDVACEGEPDATTGYLIDIRTIDHAVRTSAIAALTPDKNETSPSPEARMLRVYNAIATALAPCAVAHVTLRQSPTYKLTMEQGDMTSVLLSQRFEFSASHRLHAPTLSDEENRQIFGKCNNPNGHGHNYWFEPVVRAPLVAGAPALTLAQLERLTMRVVVERFDHKHLNFDCEEFQALNPTVERLAQVCFDLLAPEIAREGPSAVLVRVRVWETEKTFCEYPA